MNLDSKREGLAVNSQSVVKVYLSRSYTRLLLVQLLLYACISLDKRKQICDARHTGTNLFHVGYMCVVIKLWFMFFLPEKIVKYSGWILTFFGIKSNFDIET